MTHKRQRVRDAVVAKLASIEGWNGRVFANRARPTEPSELPVALVYTVAEESELANMAMGMSRTLTLNIELRVTAGSDLDDVLDDYCEAFEATMNDAPNFGGLVFVSFLRGTTIGLDGEGEARQAVGTLNYEFRYETDAAGN